MFSFDDASKINRILVFSYLVFFSEFFLNLFRDICKECARLWSCLSTETQLSPLDTAAGVTENKDAHKEDFFYFTKYSSISRRTDKVAEVYPHPPSLGNF